MKKLLIAALLMTTLATPIAYAASFSDVSQTHPHFVAIADLSEAGILNGYPDGSFQPDRIVNRVEALKVILGGANVQVATETTENPFSDTPKEQWYSPFVAKAKELGIVNGNPDGSFAPDRQVKRAEFMKMLLETNRFKKDKWEGQQFYTDVPPESWYAPYLNYAGKSGLLIPDAKGNLLPERAVTRAEMAEILYLTRIILRGRDSSFLVNQAEKQMAQIEAYIAAKEIGSAKRASELAFDFTQQALSLLPDNNIVLSAAKIAKAYDLLIDAYIAGLQQQKDKARELAELAKVKATEGWEANNDIQPVAKHIKDRADEIISQL